MKKYFKAFLLWRAAENIDEACYYVAENTKLLLIHGLPAKKLMIWQRNELAEKLSILKADLWLYPLGLNTDKIL